MDNKLLPNELPQAPTPVPDAKKQVSSADVEPARQTSNGQMFSPPAPTTQLFSPSDQLAVQPGTNTAKGLLLFLGIAFASCLFVLMLVVVLEKHRAPHSANGSFCCPREFRMVQKVLNLSTDPCEDFYANVCSMVDSGTSEHLPRFIRVDIRRRFMESAAVGAESSATGQMLAALNRRFKEEKSPEENIADLVTAIAQVAETTHSTTPSHAVRHFADLSLRYGLPSVISFIVSKEGTALTIKRNDGWSSDPRFINFSAIALDSTNKALKMSVTIQQLQHLEGALRSMKDSEQSQTLSRAITICPFSALTKGDWGAILDNLAFPTHPNVAKVQTQPGDRLDGLLSVLANADNQHAVIAYAISYTALNVHLEIQDAAESESDRPVDISCQVPDICILEDRLFAEIISTGNMNERIHLLFTQIRLNVIQQASRHPLFNGTSKAALTELLNRLQLRLPEEIAVSDLPVPAVSTSFATNLLAARTYIFDVRKAKVARKMPSTDSLFLPVIQRRGDVIFVPASVYSLLDQNSNRTVLDLPIVGVDMSAQMWSYLLNSSWPDEKRKNIKNHLQCFRDRHLSNHEVDILWTVSTALGLVSAINATVETQWNTMVDIDSTKISVGRLVYLMWAYDRCATLPEMVSRLDINLALRDSAAFGETFDCPNSSPMSHRLCCFEHC